MRIVFPMFELAGFPGRKVFEASITSHCGKYTILIANHVQTSESKKIDLKVHQMKTFLSFSLVKLSDV